jgi:hypothetical protein
MRIPGSVWKAHLENVLWIGGAACGGKSTLTDLLAKKHGLQAYHPEDHYDRHREMACEEDHPLMLRPFPGWESFFGRSSDEYASWTLDLDRELFGMVLLDTLKMSAKGPVIVDCHSLTPGLVDTVSSQKRVLFLFADEPTIRSAFFAREDKLGVLRAIQTVSDPEQAKANVLNAVCEVSARKIAQVKASGHRYLIRDAASTVEGSLFAVEGHFGLPVS